MVRRFGFMAMLLVVVASLALLYAGFSLFNTMIASHPLPGSTLRFQTIQSQTDLEGTNYVLEYRYRNVVLRDKSGRHTISIVQSYSPVATPPAYSRLWYSDARVYLVTRLASGGNGGANWYRLLKISTNPLELMPNFMAKLFNIGAIPLDLMPSSTADPENGLSCVDPRLEETVTKEALEFERSTNCADSAAARQSYEIKLT
jgi:hypothetical protein